MPKRKKRQGKRKNGRVESTDSSSEESEITPTPSMIARSELFYRSYEFATEGDFEGFKKTMGEGANKDEVFGEGTALFHFSMYGNNTAIRWLLKEKADVNVLGESDATCLMMLYHQHERPTHSQQLKEQLDIEFLETAQLLIDSRVDINAYGSVRTFDRGGSAKYRDRTVLHEAAMKFQEPYCRLLIDNKADINMRPLYYAWRGRNCLHWASLAPCPGESSEEINQISMVYSRDVPCVSTRSVEYLRFLIFKGIDVDMQDFDGKTALYFAAERGWLEGVRVLIETPMPRKLIERSSKVSAITRAGSKWGIVKVIAEQIVDFLIRISADPLIDSNKPFTLVCPNHCLEFTPKNHSYNVEDESDEEEEVNEHEGKVKAQSMMALEKSKVDACNIGNGDSKSTDLVEECQNKQGSVSSKCSSSGSEDEDEEKDFKTWKCNRDWDETCDDGTPLGVARKLNHTDIVEYLSRFS